MQPKTIISNSTLKPKLKSTGSAQSSPSAIGGNKEQPMKQRNVTTSVNLKGRARDSFSNVAGKGKDDVSSTGGIR